MQTAEDRFNIARLSLKFDVAKIAKQNEIYATQHPRLKFAIEKHITSKGYRLEFTKHGYLIDLYKDDSQEIVVNKPRQVGASEWIFVYMFEASVRKLTSFTVLPKQKLRDSYVKTRVDPLLDGGCYKAFKRKSDEGNLMLKTLKKGTNLIFVGSNSRTEMISHPADIRIIDELDYCDQEYLSLADNTLDHSNHAIKIDISTPTLENEGIDAKFSLSDQKHWFLKCPHCGHQQILDFFGNVLRKDEYVSDEWVPISEDIQLHCIKADCRKVMNRFAMGEYVAREESDISGYMIPALCHPKKTPAILYDKYIKSKKSELEKQHFLNNDLGLTYSPEGASISKKILDNCKQSYTLTSTHTDYNDCCVMGIDVGKYFHVTIWRLREEKRELVYINKLLVADDRSFAEINHLIEAYRVRQGIVDMMPETKLSSKLCEKSDFVIWGCYYSTEEQPKEIYKEDKELKQVRAHRTWVIDEMVEDYKSSKVFLPQEAHDIEKGEFYAHMQAPKRLMVRGNHGRVRFDWSEGSKPDHYFHSAVYAKVAQMLLGNYIILDSKDYDIESNGREFTPEEDNSDIFSL